MMTIFRRLGLAAVCMGMLANPLSAAPRQQDRQVDTLAAQAPQLNRKILQHAVSAMRCAINNGALPAQRLAIIDFSRPSTERRLWIFDLRSNKLVLSDLVAHGQKSGENLATRFSNVEGSNQSSLGLFRTQESYIGKHGYSLRMDGLEPGINDLARERAIVIHPADYVSPALIRSQGRIGRSLGCPAVRPEVAQQVVDSLKGGQFMFSYYPDQRWLQSSVYLNCQPKLVASLAAARGG